MTRVTLYTSTGKIDIHNVVSASFPPTGQAVLTVRVKDPKKATATKYITTLPFLITEVRRSYSPEHLA